MLLASCISLSLTAYAMLHCLVASRFNSHNVMYLQHLFGTFMFEEMHIYDLKNAQKVKIVGVYAMYQYESHLNQQQLFIDIPFRCLLVVYFELNHHFC